MGKYYFEEIEKTSSARKNYAKSVEDFLFEKKRTADEARNLFVSPEKYKRDPEKYRKSLIFQLGFPLYEPFGAAELIEKKFVATDKNVNIYRMRFLCLGKIEFYGIYFEQTEKPENSPFVVCFHGGEGTPEVVSSIYLNSANYNHLARRLTDRKANVFAPQLLLWSKEFYGEKYDRLSVDGKLRRLKGSVTALELTLCKCCIDYFIAEEKINAERIGAAGMSYGGMYALHLAATDERIKACYSCSWVNDDFVNSWADWSYYGAEYNFTVVETAGIVAPRPLVVAMGDKDELFDGKATVKACEKIREYYAAFSADDNFKYCIFDGGHEVDKSDAEINFLLKN
ncbi:MAG: hypothetical protein IJS67_00445, partial [Clostridia bacterium]|nr:hypothetical protein [Clostridia bacterium]